MDTNTLVVVAVGLTAIVTTIVIFCRNRSGIPFDDIYDTCKYSTIRHGEYRIQTYNSEYRSSREVQLYKSGERVAVFLAKGPLSPASAVYAPVLSHLYSCHLSKVQSKVDDFLFEQASEELK